MMELPGSKVNSRTMGKRLPVVKAVILPSFYQRSLPAIGLLVSLFIMGCLMSTAVFAAAPMPDIPKGKGDKCVEDTQFMRESHMTLLLHQRDDTLRRGIRTKKHSLMECLDCHVVKDNNNQPVSAANPKHFCRTCHDYASVNIDCFDCHASKPAKNSTSLPTGANNLPFGLRQLRNEFKGLGYAGLGAARVEPAVDPSKDANNL